MAHSTTSRRFYIDVDSTDDHTVVRRVPVHKADWVAPETDNSNNLTPSSPATHSTQAQSRPTPHRVSDMLRAVRKRPFHHSR